MESYWIHSHIPKCLLRGLFLILFENILEKKTSFFLMHYLGEIIGESLRALRERESELELGRGRKQRSVLMGKHLSPADACVCGCVWVTVAFAL